MRFPGTSPRPRARTPGAVRVVWAVALVVLTPVAIASGTEVTPRTFGDLTHSTPPEFSSADDAALERFSSELRGIRARLLSEKMPPADELALTARAQELLRDSAALAAKRKAWEAFRGRRASDSTSSPSLSATSPDGKVDLNVLAPLFSRFHGLDVMRASARRASAAEWEKMARDFEVLHPVKFALTAGDPNAAYLLRAMLLQGECELFASVEHHRNGNRAGFARTYESGTQRLDTVIRLFANAAHLRETISELEKLPEDPAKFPFAIAGALNSSGTQTATSVKARRLLAEFCPWGYQVWATLKDARMSRALDPVVLRPYSGDDPRRIAITPLADTDVPRSIRQDLAAVASGRFPFPLGGGKPIVTTWSKTAPPSYSLWIMSPAAYEMPPSEKLAWALRAVKLVREGWIELLWDETKDFAMNLVARRTEEQGAIYFVCAKAKDLDDFGFGYEFVAKGEQFSRYELAKEVLFRGTQMVENSEIEHLCGIDPKDPDLGRPILGAKTYTGDPMPLVLLRADFMAEQKLPDLAYPRAYHLVVYYYLDGSGLLGRADPYDLTVQAEHALKQRTAYLAGDENVQRATWRRLPDVPKAPGARLYVTDLAPTGQSLKVSLGDDALARWRQGMKSGDVLVGQLWEPAPFNRCLTTVEITKPEVILRVANSRRPRPSWPLDIRFHGVECSAQEPLTEYALKVGIARRQELDTTAARPPAIVEKEVIPLRLLPTGGKPVTGKLSIPTETEPMSGARTPKPAFIQLTYEHGKAAAPVFDLNPPGHDWPLLTTRIAVKGVTGPDSVLKSALSWSSTYYTTIDFSASVAPVDRGWHRLTFEIGGRPYTVWDQVDRPGSAAIFKATLPVPVGTATVVVRTENATPITFKTMRGPNPKAAALDVAKWRQAIAGAEKSVSLATNIEGRMRDYHAYLERQTNFAWALIDADQSAAARPLLQEVIRQWPSDSLQQQSLRTVSARAWCDSLVTVHECRMKADYALGDAASLPNSVKQWFASIMNAIALNARESKRAPSGYDRVARNCAYWIHACIHLGVPAGTVRELIGLYGQARRADGSYQPPYDEFEFLHGPEGR